MLNVRASLEGSLALAKRREPFFLRKVPSYPVSFQLAESEQRAQLAERAFFLFRKGGASRGPLGPLRAWGKTLSLSL